MRGFVCVQYEFCEHDSSFQTLRAQVNKLLILGNVVEYPTSDSSIVDF